MDLSVISSLVDAMLHTSLDDVLLPAANWVLELQDIQDQMKSSLNLSYSYEGIIKFQNLNSLTILLSVKIYKIVLALKTL